jgi:hypothetical protein
MGTWAATLPFIASVGDDIVLGHKDVQAKLAEEDRIKEENEKKYGFWGGSWRNFVQSFTGYEHPVAEHMMPPPVNSPLLRQWNIDHPAFNSDMGRQETAELKGNIDIGGRIELSGEASKLFQLATTIAAKSSSDNLKLNTGRSMPSAAPFSRRQ